MRDAFQECAGSQQAPGVYSLRVDIPLPEVWRAVQPARRACEPSPEVRGKASEAAWGVDTDCARVMASMYLVQECISALPVPFDHVVYN